MPNVALAVELVAARQHRVVTLRQLSAAGFSRRAIQHRVVRGDLRPLHRGVYAVGQAELSQHGRFLAAVLALGPGAVLSHQSAAVLWHGAALPEHEPLHVTVPRRVRPRAGIVVHSAEGLGEGDTTLRERIPVTTPARTLLDLAAILPEHQLRRAINQALVDRRTSLPQLRRQSDQNNPRPGSARLRAALDAGAAPTRSPLEDILLDLIRDAGLPTPRTNVKVAGLEVDVLFPAHRVILEADGARFHDNPLARAEDRRRQAILEAAGHAVLRITHDEATRRRGQTLARIDRALYRSGSAR